MAVVDLYCERVGATLLAEPINAATNAAFLVAACLVWRFARREGGPTGGTWLLIGLTVAFGLGSALFHTVANTATRVLDALPIALFIVTYLWLYVRQVLNLSGAIATTCAAAFGVAVIGARQFPDLLNGSLIYAPALALVTALGVVHLMRMPRERGSLIAAALVLALALVLRTLDNAVCAEFPFGTHFLWHLLTALTLYLSTRALIANTATRVRAQSRVSAPLQ